MSNLTDMEIFARVVSAGSMSAAGREMNLSPAVVSKRIRRLEEKLGTRLLQRTTRQIAMTEAGQGFYERVVAIIASVEEAESFVSRGSARARGSLKVAVPTSFGRLHIAPHLGNFLTANPDLTVNLDLSDDFVDIVGDGYDLAIRIAELSDSSLVARKLSPVHRVLCASPSYIARYGMPETIEDLSEHVTLAATNQDPWRLAGPDGIETVRTRAPVKTNSNEVIRECLLAGVGIALRSTWDVGPELREGKLQILLPHYRASRDVGLYAVYPSRQFLPAKVRVFIDFLAGLYGSEPYWDTGLEDWLRLPSRAKAG
ncbi:LysR family transcriptional regulator [Roseibium porphyridii]|uniref:LysR family transcriptional regulator n=1 Tax=Roseibium porphyridii TaxID=2866279 RepID=A0ABY8F0P7_9HYPH|nr:MULTISPECIES: LysR family transcriptional regulator [Stappiaceae]QFT33779.1 HTH-type transcriptional regulator DmlR [Labrenzia sp. THAF82]WFE89032.1 LysR family transcriptional regulator [Roseibium sp. KMA01]